MVTGDKVSNKAKSVFDDLLYRSARYVSMKDLVKQKEEMTINKLTAFPYSIFPTKQAKEAQSVSMALG